MLYHPSSLNAAFHGAFALRGWTPSAYTPGYQPSLTGGVVYRKIDFVKNRLGGEIQFGKYAFMVYNVCAKMTIFRNLGVIDAGVEEIVPVKDFADEMSTGVSYFEQFVWDLETRGVADIDIPVLILGVSA